MNMVHRLNGRGNVGFSLIELLIALAIAMIISASIASLFAQSVSTRARVDKDGVRIENGRYAISILTDDLKLAGYWGSYSPPNKWASVDWETVAPFQDCASTPVIVPLIRGWTNSANTPQIPNPIFGIESHGTAVGSAISGCLGDYLRGDILVVRRASTRVTPIGALSSARTYLQASACPLDSLNFLFYVGVGETGKTDVAPGSFALRPVGCTTTSAQRAPIRELLTRVYYIAANNETGDGIPTLKMLELGEGVLTPRTIAPGIEDLHLEFGLDHTIQDGQIDEFMLANNNPSRKLSDFSLTGTPIGSSWRSVLSDDAWEDVMAVKAFVVARDLIATPGLNNNLSFVLGQVTSAPQSADFRTKVSSAVVRVTNMSGRRP